MQQKEKRKAIKAVTAVAEKYHLKKNEELYRYNNSMRRSTTEKTMGSIIHIQLEVGIQNEKSLALHEPSNKSKRKDQEKIHIYTFSWKEVSKTRRLLSCTNPQITQGKKPKKIHTYIFSCNKQLDKQSFLLLHQ